jgi:hypothetical protein
MRARTEVKVSLASVAETNANATMRSGHVKFCLIEAVVAIEIRLDGEVINIEGQAWACDRLMRSARRSAAYDRGRKHNRDKRNKRCSSAAYHHIV